MRKQLSFRPDLQFSDTPLQKPDFATTRAINASMESVRLPRESEDYGYSAFSQTEEGKSLLK